MKNLFLRIHFTYHNFADFKVLCWMCIFITNALQYFKKKEKWQNTDFLSNQIVLIWVHARERVNTHKIACKSSLVRIRCPLSWENIWPHTLFFKIRAFRSPADHEFCSTYIQKCLSTGQDYLFPNLAYRKSSKDSATIFSNFNLFGEIIF